MKRLLLTSAIIICSFLASFAQQATATIFSENGEKFWIVMNGQKQNAAAQTNVKLTALTEPYYKIKIIFEDETLGSVDDDIRTVGAENEPEDVTYVIKKNNKGKYVMRVNSFQAAKGSTEPAKDQVSVPAHADQKPQQTTQGGAQQTGGGSVTTTTTTHQTTTSGNTNPNGGNVGMSVNDGMGGNVQFNMNVSGMDLNAGGASTTTTTTTHTTSTSSSSNDNYSQPANNTAAPAPAASNKCMSPMSSTTFSNAKKQVEGQSFEENKLQVAKQVLKANCISTAQIKEMLGQFSFEKTKVDYAKFAYDRCTDQGDYFNLNDAFSFSSSVTELNDYINSK
jgi:hypothetical protein